MIQQKEITSFNRNGVPKEVRFIPDREFRNRIGPCRDLPISQKAQTEKEIVEQPHQTWYYASNHVLVNRERMMRGILPLMRVVALDELARSIAVTAASMYVEEKSSTWTPNFVSKSGRLLSELIKPPYEGNVLHGSSIRSIHNTVMICTCKEKDNILKASFQQFGVATFKREDGVLFLCQLFRRIGRVVL
jgi:hypothetical protein